MWALEDMTKGDKGYLRITFNGQRVADVFPFAPDTSPELAKSRATHLIEALNGAHEWRRISYEEGTAHAALLHTDEGAVLAGALDALTET